MPTMFGPFEILGKLGQGGMGAVYKARQPEIDRIVALKILNPHVATPQTFERFKREMQVLGKLKHPNIVQLYTTGVEKNRCYFTMEYIEGKSLAAMIAEAKTPEQRRALVWQIAKVARIVHYAHTQKVIHRDLKPANILIDKAGEPHVVDFGVAKELESGQAITVTGAAIGTPAYMAPEQAEGKRELIGPACDIYSLGAMLYEALCGKPPFEGKTAAEILQKVVTEDPIPLRKRGPAIHKGFERICKKCMAKNPTGRCSDGETLANAIEKGLAGTFEAQRADDTERQEFTWKRIPS